MNFDFWGRVQNIGAEWREGYLWNLFCLKFDNS
jgi:hypothetical protein